MSNLIEGIQAECDRLRQCVVNGKEIGPAGFFYVAMAQSEIKRGEAAIASGDTVQMVSALQSMREFKE